MTTLVTADLHFSDNSRDSYRFRIFKTMHKIIKDHEVNLVLILGDITEEKDEHPSRLVNRIVNHLYRLAKECRIIIMKGNHDFLGDPNNPFFSFLGKIPNITWINNPTETKALRYHTELGNSIFLPHTNNYKKDWKSLTFSNYRWIFCHQTFAGTMIGGRHAEGIPLEIFPIDRIISGDIHIPGDDPVTYVGAPYAVDFGDDYSPRMLLLDGKRKTSIPVPGPQKRLLELRSINDIQRPLKVKINAGDILKVRVDIAAKDYARWHDYQEIVRSWGEVNKYVIHMVQPIVSDRTVDADVKNRIRETKTDEEVLTSYGKQRGIDSKTMRTGEKLL